MARAASSDLQAITANRLGDGLVVFLAEGGNWVEDCRLAAAYDGKDAVAAALAVGVEAEKALVVLGAYAIDVAEGPNGLEPTRLRERIRAFGPTARTDAVAVTDATRAA